MIPGAMVDGKTERRNREQMSLSTFRCYDGNVLIVIVGALYVLRSRPCCPRLRGIELRKFSGGYQAAKVMRSGSHVFLILPQQAVDWRTGLTLTQCGTIQLIN